MKTECTAGQLEFHGLGRRVVVGEFDGGKIQATTGHTVKIASGTRFRPSFPEDAEYIPVCLPAFRPDRCIREDINADGEMISQNLKKLHGQ